MEACGAFCSKLPSWALQSGSQAQIAVIPGMLCRKGAQRCSCRDCRVILGVICIPVGVALKATEAVASLWLRETCCNNWR